MNVVALCGSLRSTSRTRLALAVAVAGARAAGGEVGEVRLDGLPLFDETRAPTPEVIEFKTRVRTCDALLIATPVYHDSYSGLLKNAIDHLYDELAEKVAGVIAVAGGRAGPGQALEHLRAVLRETNTWVLPRQVTVASAAQAFDDAGAPKEAEIASRLERLGQEVVLRAKLLRPRRPPISRG